MWWLQRFIQAQIRSESHRGQRWDFVEPFLRKILSFVGIDSVQTVRAEGVKIPMPCQEQKVHFGWLAHFAAMDSPASSERTRKLLGWQPRQTGLIADLDAAQFFEPGTDRVVAAR